MQNLKSKYEHQEMKVSDSLWGRLEEKLDQVPAKEKKPKVIWWRYAAAAAVLIFVLSGIFWMTNTKVESDYNQQFANQTENSDNQTSIPSEQSGNVEIIKSNPVNPISNSDNQKFVVENVKDNQSVKKEKSVSNQIPEKELIIKKEEPQIVSKPEEQLAQTDIQKPREKVKYVSSSDLLFGVEIDKAKAEIPKSAMGINTIKSKNDSDFPNPKRIKLFGITLYEKDSITTK